jgi:hypothetical protein
MTINGSFTDMEIVYDASVLTTEIKYQYIDGKPTIPTLPHQITLTEARAGIGTDPILFTPTSAKCLLLHMPAHQKI